MFERKVSLEEWLRDADHAPELGVLTAVKAHHMIVSESGRYERGDEVDGRVFEQGKAWSPKEEASRILGKCAVYAQGLRGVQTFKLFAFYGQAEPTAFHHVTVSGKSGEMGETEDASPRGALAQAMRQGDGVVNRAFGMFDRLWQVNEHLLTKYETERNYYHQQFREAEGVIIGMVREKIAESHSQRMKEMEFERSTNERNKFIAFLPAMIRHITGGKEVIPDGLADSSILETAAEVIRKMPDDQKTETMTKLAGVSPELAMVLGARLTAIIERQNRDEEAIRLLSAVKTEEQKARDREIADEAMGQGLNKPRLNS